MEVLPELGPAPWSSRAGANPTRPPRLRVALQVPFIALYLLLTLVHVLLLSWLFLLPRYRREWLATRLTMAPWLGYTRWFLRPRITLSGGEHRPDARLGHLFVANHESAVDVPVLVECLRGAFLMKRSLLLSPFGWGGHWIGCVGVDRASRRSRVRALRHTVAMAQRAQAMIVFPEGTFGHVDGRLRAPHLNLLRLAYDAGLALVPVGHAGTRRALDGDALPFNRGVAIAVALGAPLRPADFPDRDAFAAACWREVGTLVVAARGLVPPGPPYAAPP